MTALLVILGVFVVALCYFQFVLRLAIEQLDRRVTVLETPPVRETFERMQATGVRVTLRGNGRDRAYRVKMQGNSLPRVVRVHGELRNWYRLTDAKEDWPVYELVVRDGGAH